MQPVSESSSMQGLADEKLGFGILSPDTGHHAASGFRRNYIRHWLPADPLPRLQNPDQVQPAFCHFP